MFEGMWSRKISQSAMPRNRSSLRSRVVVVAGRIVGAIWRGVSPSPNSCARDCSLWLTNYLPAIPPTVSILQQSRLKSHWSPSLMEVAHARRKAPIPCGDAPNRSACRAAVSGRALLARERLLFLGVYHNSYQSGARDGSIEEAPLAHHGR